MAAHRDEVVHFVQQLVRTDRLLLRQAGRPDLVQVSRGSREALRAVNACLRREFPV